IPDRRPFVLQELIASMEKGIALHDQDVANTKQYLWMTQFAGLPAGGPRGALALFALQPKMEASHQGAIRSREAALEVLRKYRLLAEVQRLEDDGKAKTPEWTKLATELTASERRFAWLKARNAIFGLKHGLAPRDPKEKQTPQQNLAEAEKA